MANDQNDNDSEIVLYPGDMIEGTDILQYGETFVGIVIDIRPKNVYSDYGYDQMHTTVYVENYHYMFVMYDGGYSGMMKMNLKFIKDIKVLYRNCL